MVNAVSDSNPFKMPTPELNQVGMGNVPPPDMSSQFHAQLPLNSPDKVPKFRQAIRLPKLTRKGVAGVMFAVLSLVGIASARTLLGESQDIRNQAYTTGPSQPCPGGTIKNSSGQCVVPNPPSANPSSQPTPPKPKTPTTTCPAGQMLSGGNCVTVPSGQFESIPTTPPVSVPAPVPVTDANCGSTGHRTCSGQYYCNNGQLSYRPDICGGVPE